MKIVISYVNAHQRIALAQEGFNHQVDRVTCSMGTSLSSATPVIASLLNGLVNKVTIVAGMEVMHGLSYMDFHSPRLT